MMKTAVSGITDTGMKRSNNEDNFLIGILPDGIQGDIESPADTSGGIYVIVSDGMGGAASGEVASHTAVNRSFDFLKNNPALSAGQALEKALIDANESVRRIISKNPETTGMGAVATALFFKGSEAFVGQVGDTRLYLFRDGKLKQLTKDQSLVDDMVASGVITAEQAKTHPQKNAVTQAIGPTEDLKPAMNRLDLKNKDRLLLCSDGLSGEVDDPEIEKVLGSGKSRKEIGAELVSMANSNGGADNITVVLVDIEI